MEVDLNGDGTIDFQEFMAMMKKKQGEDNAVEVFIHRPAAKTT